MKLSTLFRLDSVGSSIDPVSIALAPSLSTTNPSESGSITTAPGGSYDVALSDSKADVYTLIANTGSSTSGNIVVTDGSGNKVAVLKPSDFFFAPIKATSGARIEYDTASTTVNWFTWTRL